RDCVEIGAGVLNADRRIYLDEPVAQEVAAYRLDGLVSFVQERTHPLPAKSRELAAAVTGRGWVTSDQPCGAQRLALRRPARLDDRKVAGSELGCSSEAALDRCESIRQSRASAIDVNRAPRHAQPPLPSDGAQPNYIAGRKNPAAHPPKKRRVAKLAISAP